MARTPDPKVHALSRDRIRRQEASGFNRSVLYTGRRRQVEVPCLEATTPVLLTRQVRAQRYPPGRLFSP